MPTPIREGQTATSKDGKSRVVFRGGQWTNDTTYRAPIPTKQAITSSADRKSLEEARARAAAERDAARQYDSADKAVTEMGTGPVKGWWLDVITPEESKGGGRTWGDVAAGAADALGAALGMAARPLVSQRTFTARDRLQTLSAQAALSHAGQLKGAASDKDTALIRMAGLSPYKSEKENHRIIADARYQSGLAQERANSTSYWIGKYGSLSTTAPNGVTFDQYLRGAEGRYASAQAAKRRPLPKAPPRGRGPVTIDLNGNPTR